MDTTAPSSLSIIAPKSLPTATKLHLTYACSLHCQLVSVGLAEVSHNCQESSWPMLATMVENCLLFLGLFLESFSQNTGILGPPPSPNTIGRENRAHAKLVSAEWPCSQEMRGRFVSVALETMFQRTAHASRRGGPPTQGGSVRVRAAPEVPVRRSSEEVSREWSRFSSAQGVQVEQSMKFIEESEKRLLAMDEVRRK